MLGSTPANAEDKLALTFELPPAQVAATHPIIRYQDSLPPISPSAEQIDSEEVALRFAQYDVAMPTAERNTEEARVGTVPDAFTLEATAESVLAANSEPDANWLASNKGVNSKRVSSLQQRLSRGTESESALGTANILEADFLEDWIYDGGSDSLVARTVGSAEGTRRSDGQRTMAYYGHVDPGNGVWNLGTFSYQHEAGSPEEADEKQLRRLQRQERQLKEKAARWNVSLSMEVRLNGLDLANQAPLAALDKGGYIERLAEAYEKGKSGEAAISWARTHAYFDPDKQAWDAPGLGNNRYSIQRDQERRMAAIDKALRLYQSEHVGQLAGLSDLHIASASPANDSLLLAQQPNSVTILDFSLDPVSFSAPESVEAASSQAPISAEPVSAVSVPELSPDVLTEELAASEADASETAVTDDSLEFDEDLLALGEWDERYETIAKETSTFIETEETEAIFVSDDQADVLEAVAVSAEAAPVSESKTDEAPESKLASEIVRPAESATKPQLNSLQDGIEGSPRIQLLEGSGPSATTTSESASDATAEILAFERSAIGDVDSPKVSMREEKQTQAKKRFF